MSNVYAHTWMKPTNLSGFNRSLADPKWRWFWNTVIFADPLVQGGNTARVSGWDYAAWAPADVIEAGLTMEIGPRGWRRRWDGSTTVDYGFNSSNLTAYRSAWAHAGDLSAFVVVEPVTMNVNDAILMIEGGVNDTTAENSNLFIAENGAGQVQYIHESGAGANQAVIAPSSTTNAGSRISLGLTRDIPAKRVDFYRDGLFRSTGTYGTNPAITDRQAVSVGDRIGTDTQYPSDSYIECAYVAKVKWTPAQFVALHRDPWGPFRTAYRRTGVGGGGGPTYTGVRPQTAWLG